MHSGIAALLTSVFVLIAGNTLLSTLVPLRGKLEGFPPVVIGLLGSVYFLGMLAGTIAAPAAVRWSGHIRAFTAFVAGSVCIALAYPLLVTPWAWIVLRGCLGFAFAGLYSVVEAWLSAKSSNANRGRVYAIYQIVNFLGSASGQQLIPLNDPRAFVLFSAAGMLFALAILPLAFTSSDPPNRPASISMRLGWVTKISPVGAAGALFIGMANGAFYSLGPVYPLGFGLGPGDVASFMTSVILGSALGVYPVGRLSDLYDRRYLMAGFAMLGCLVEVTLSMGGFTTPRALDTLGFCVGLSTMVLYTLAVSHANDRAGPDNAVSVSSSLLFLYCVGAIIAPTVASALMSRFGVQALFAQNALVHLSLALYTLWRIVQRRPATLITRPERPGRVGTGLP